MFHLLKNKLTVTSRRNHFKGLLIIFIAFFSLPLQAQVDNLNNNVSSIAGVTSRDFDEILHSGKLRVLYLPRHPDSLSISGTEHAMLEKFANDNDLTLEWIPVDHSWSLLPDLVSGKGDVIIGQGQSITAGLAQQARFTLPWVTSRQQVVVRADTTRISSLDDLTLRQVALKKSSTVWHAMSELAQNNPSMDLVVIPEQMPRDAVMQRVASGEYDVTIADSDYLDNYLPQHPELTVAYDLTSGEAKSWAVNENAAQLQLVLNQFLNKNHLEFNIAEVHFDDLPRIKERKILRLITYSNPVNYFFSGGRFYGFEYELLRKFARAQKMRVDVVLANSHEEMQKLLVNGEGDVIAAALPASSIEGNKIRFTAPYDFSAPIIVGRDSGKTFFDIRDLEGRRITISAESPYKALLEKIHDHGINFDLEIAAPGIDTETVLSRVSDGIYDLTVLDSNQFNSEIAKKYSLKSQFSLSEPAPHGWAVRAADVQLLSALNDFIQNNYRGNFYNTLYAKYIEHPQSVVKNKFMANVNQLSPYDDLVRKYADEYSFDWRLIVAQMYQESRFNPAATSHAGAEGLMQIMPTTAESIGGNNLNDPATSIKIGVKYLSILRDRFEDDLLLEDRTWFSLASYNAGFGRVNQARKQAEKMGLNPNKWFGNVEKAMLAMAQPFKKDGELIRNCRCGETVVYVHEIRTLYNNYVRLTQATQLAHAETATWARVPYDI